jgi:peptidoglycan hydrolase CwlO-like protein
MDNNAEIDAQISQLENWISRLNTAKGNTINGKEDFNSLYKKMKKNENEINCWYGGVDWEGQQVKKVQKKFVYGLDEMESYMDTLNDRVSTINRAIASANSEIFSLNSQRTTE